MPVKINVFQTVQKTVQNVTNQTSVKDVNQVIPCLKIPVSNVTLSIVTNVNQKTSVMLVLITSNYPTMDNVNQFVTETVLYVKPLKLISQVYQELVKKLTLVVLKRINVSSVKKVIFIIYILGYNLHNNICFSCNVENCKACKAENICNECHKPYTLTG